MDKEEATGQQRSILTAYPDKQTMTNTHHHPVTPSNYHDHHKRHDHHRGTTALHSSPPLLQDSHSVAANSTASSKSWRSAGQKLRKRLVRTDEGVNGFSLNPKCSIEKYRQVSDKVSVFVFANCVCERV